MGKVGAHSATDQLSLIFFLIPRKAYFCFSKKSRPPVLTYYSSVAEFSTDLVVLKVNEKCIHDV